MNLHGKIRNIKCDPGNVAAGFDAGTLTRDQVTHYKLGHKDARHAAAEQALKADACIEALRTLLAGNEYRSIAGDAPAWHMKSIPREADLDRAREALAALDR